MPSITIPMKTIVLNEDTRRILEFFDNAVDRYRQGEEGPAALTHAQALPVDLALVTNVLARLETLFNLALGANNIILPASDHHLSVEAHLLFIDYRQFLIDILKEHKGNATFDLIAGDRIDNRSVLVTHLLIRLAAVAIDNNQQARGSHVILRTIQYFFEQLIDSDVLIDRKFLARKYYSSYAGKLFSTLNVWQLVFRGMIDAVQLLNSNKDKIDNALGELIRVRQALTATMIAECRQLLKRDLESQHSLKDEFLGSTFVEGCQQLAVRYRLPENEDANYGALLVATALPRSLQKLFEIIGRESNTLSKLSFLLIETNKLAKIAEKLSNIIIGAGWFPFMAGIINTADLNKMFTGHVTQIVAVINEYLKNGLQERYRNLDVAILRNKNLRTFMMALDTITIVDGLADLNNPKLLKQLSERFQNEVGELLSLQQKFSCSIIDTSKLQQLMGSLTFTDISDSDNATLSTLRSLFNTAVTTFQNNPVAADAAFTNLISSTSQMIPIYELSLFHKGALLLQNHQYQAALDCFHTIKMYESDKLHYNKALCHLGLNNLADVEVLLAKITDPLLPVKQIFAQLNKPATTASSFTNNTRGSNAFFSKGSQPASASRADSVNSADSRIDHILEKFRNFNYHAKLNERVTNRELKITTAPASKEAIKAILKQDIKAKNKTLYLYPKKENNILSWHYFYAKNDGKIPVTAQIPIQLTPVSMSAYYAQPTKIMPDELKKYLLCILLDYNFFDEFSKNLNVNHLSRNEIELSQLDSDSNQFTRK